MALNYDSEVQGLRERLDAGWIGTSQYNKALQELNGAYLAGLEQELQRQGVDPGAARAEIIRQQSQLPQPTIDLASLKQNLDAQVAAGWITPDQANAEYQRQQTILEGPLSPYQKSIAVPGEISTGTRLGVAREINPANISDVDPARTARIDPVSLAQVRDIGAINPLQRTDIAPAALAQNSTIAPLGQATTTGVNESAFYSKQQALAEQLEAQARGEGPSLAQLQLEEGLDAALKNQMGALAAQPGVDAGLAARLYGQQAGQQQQAAAREAARIRLAEQLSAREQLAGLANQARQTDVGVQQGNQAAQNAFTLAQSELNRAQASLDQANAQFNAGQITQQQLAQAQLNFNTALSNFQATNQRQVEQADLGTRVDLANQLAANTQAYNQAQLVNSANQFNTAEQYKQALNQAELDQNAALSNQSAFNQRNIAQGQIAGGVQQASIAGGATIGAADRAANATITAAELNLIGDLATGTNPTITADGGGPAGTDNDPTLTGSDSRFKKNIQKGGSAARDMMNQLAAAIYEYKNGKKHGDGKQVGVMAQDLEKSALGKQMVESKKDGKYINFAKGLGAVLAAQADLNQRLSQVEANA